MLRLTPALPVETLWDALLPELVRRLPTDLERLDQLLADPELLVPFQQRWKILQGGVLSTRGRPTLAMATYLRLMLIKHRYGWGYETLMKEVSDSLHLRRFCLIPLVQRVPAESTVRKLTRRLGSEVLDELIRELFQKACREKRFRPRAMRTDSTVAQADIRYPTDAGLCGDAVKHLVRAAGKLKQAIPSVAEKVRDRSRALGKRLRALGRSLRRRTEQAKGSVRRLTEESAAQVRASVREAQRLLDAAKRARSRAKGTSKRARQKAIDQLQQTVALAEKVVEQVRQRFAGEKIQDRLVSFADPDARPIRRGKLARPNEFGYVVQLAEVTENTQRGARGLLLPPKLQAGSTHENTLLPETVAELTRMGVTLKEAVFDAGFRPEPTTKALAEVKADVFIVGTPHPGSRRTRRRLARFRVGCEGRIAHVKREYGAGRCKLRGIQGAKICESWAILAYNLDTLARGKVPT